MFYDEYIRLCNEKGMSPTAVAKESGLSGAHVTKWKNGSTPTDATIYKICDYFGLASNYFKRTEFNRKASHDEIICEIHVALVNLRNAEDTLRAALERLKANGTVN